MNNKFEALRYRLAEVASSLRIFCSISFCLLLIGGATEAFAALPGEINTAFGTNGTGTISTFPNEVGYLNDSAIDSNGRIVTVGVSCAPSCGSNTNNVAVARFTSAGQPDTSFGTNGVVKPNLSGIFSGIGVATAVAVTSDKITVVANMSQSHYIIFRLNSSDGSFDTSFGTGGVFQLYQSMNALGEIHDVAIQADGKTVVVGRKAVSSTYDVFIARLKVDGTLDDTFGEVITGSLRKGWRQTDVENGSFDTFHSVAIDSNGKIVAVGGTSGGGRTYVFRYDSLGDLDLTFSGDGINIINIGISSLAYKVAIQPDNKIVTAGYIGQTINSVIHVDFALMRFNTDGTLDQTFNENVFSTSTPGLVITDIGSRANQGRDIGIQKDGKIVVVGDNTHTEVVRYSASGKLDKSFGKNGISERTTVGNTRSLNLISDATTTTDIIIGVSKNSNPHNLAYPVLKLIAGKSTHPSFDFDGDRQFDFSIFRPSNGQWWIRSSSTLATSAATFGVSTDILAPADFTGDGKTDISFYRPGASGEWFVLRSENSTYYSFPFGNTGDIPRPGDFDGDTKADPVLFRPSTGIWYIINSSDSSYTITGPHGTTGDIPLVADFDDDSVNDLAVFRPSNNTWYWKSSLDSSNNTVVSSGDIPTPADFNGDGKTDVATFTPSTGEWRIYSSPTVFTSTSFGTTGDKPVPADYDRDGKDDIAIWRDSSAAWWIINSSTSSASSSTFGASGDKPTPFAFLQ